MVECPSEHEKTIILCVFMYVYYRKNNVQIPIIVKKKAERPEVI